MAGPPDLLERIDRIMAELAELRAELAGAEAAEVENFHFADDLATGNLIEVSTAVARFNRPPDSIRWMCRTQGCGKKVGGRWLVSPLRLARYLNGGG
jgi:hypothetical protein